MLKLLISLLFIFSLSLAITREDIIKLAEEKTSQIKLSKKDLEFIEAQIKEVMSNIYPHLEINGIYTRYDSNYITGFSLENQYKASVSLKQAIFDKSVFESIKIAKLNRELQKLILKQVKNEIIYTALTLYEDILYKKNLLQIKQKTLKYWQKQLELIEENYKQGFINKFEYLRTKAQYENAIAEVELAKINYQKALVNLKKFLLY
ncbi:MAG TPA: TolC family protein [Hydrogenothermaceae bacterium]|nr:TolC family protein [Hydrogenothermaceae bacterium]